MKNILLLVLVTSLIFAIPVSAQDGGGACGDATMLISNVQSAVDTGDFETALSLLDEVEAALECLSMNDGSETVLIEAVDEYSLTINDMPAGWSLVQLDDNEDDDASLWCTHIELFSESEASVITFSKGNVGPFFAQVIFAFPTIDESIDFFNETIDAANECSVWIDVDDNGEETEHTLSLMSFPQFGDDLLSVHESANILEMEYVFIRKTNVIILFIQFSTLFGDSIDSELTVESARITMERMP